MNPQPFVKWAGGKRKIADWIEQQLPKRIQRYVEPFAGGAAVFFRIHARIDEALLRDVNPELMTTYRMVRDRTTEIIEKIEEHARRHGKEHYYRVRDSGEYEGCELDVAARLIYLNKTGFNGLYRVNRKGQFNVAMGRYEKPFVCDGQGLKAAASALSKAVIEQGSFDEARVRESDTVYCDPPYDGAFTGYSAHPFNDDSQRMLRAQCNRWHEAGAFVLVSNSDTEFITRLYAGCTLNQVMAPRAINSDTKGRKPVAEVLIGRPWPEVTQNEGLTQGELTLGT